MKILASYRVRCFVMVHRRASFEAVSDVIHKNLGSIADRDHSMMAAGIGRIDPDNFSLSVYIDEDVADEIIEQLKAAVAGDKPYSDAEMKTLKKGNPKFFGRIPIEGAFD